MNISDKVFVVLGGTGGLGLGVVKFLINSNGNVIVTYSKEKYFDDLKEKLGNPETLYGVLTNVLDEESVLNLVDKTIKLFGKVDVLVNLVGGFLSGIQVHELKVDDLQKQFDLNLKSAFISCKCFLPKMLEKNSGRIINIGARPGLDGEKGVSAYAASKAALINFTKSLADELKETDINANIIIPSIIDTGANRKSSPDEDFSKWVSAESLGKVIKFLSSGESKDINGAVIPVYGKS